MTRDQQPSNAATGWNAMTVGLILGLGTLISLARIPVAHWQVVWAEDANIFLDEAIHSGPWSVLFQGYAGYQHLVPRLGAALAVTFFDLSRYPIVVVVLCSVLTAGVAAAVFHLSRDLVSWIPARIGLAGITLLLPLAAQEVLGNLADIHSYAMWLVPWLVLATPRTSRAAWAWAVVAFLCAMSEVQSVIFLALVPFRLGSRHARVRPVLGALVLGAAAQLATTAMDPRPSTASWPGVWSIVKGYLVNTVLPMINPNPGWQEPWLLSHGVWLPALALIPFAVAVAYVLWWGTGPQRVLVVTLVLASAAIYAGGAILDGSWWFYYGQHTNANGWEGLLNSRYGVSSGLMLSAVIPLAAAVLVGRTRGSSRWQSAVALLAVFGQLGWYAAAATQTVSSRTADSFTQSVESAAVQCVDEPAQTEVPLPVAPDRVLFLTCEQVLRHERTD